VSGNEHADVERQRWLEERRGGIGGSDAATILGVGKWGSPLEVWLEKTGRAPEREQTEAMWWGAALEDLIARRYSEVTGRALLNPRRVMHHADHPEIIGTPDRLVVGGNRGVEVKNVDVHLAGEWGRPGTDHVPHVYLVQCCHYMGVMNLPLWDVAALFGGNEMRIYTVARDLTFERSMIGKLLRWWNDYVVADRQPPVDASSGDALAIMYPENRMPLLEATPGAEIAAATYLANALALKQLNNQTDEIENILKSMIGEHEGIAGDGWKATWKRAAGARRTDWEQVSTLVADRLAEAIGPAEAQRTLAAAREQAVIESAGSRRFRCVKVGGNHGNR
jgi:putative phage-type endonuclease